MQATPGIMRTAMCAGQDYIERVPLSISALVVCVSVASVVNVASTWNFETGAHMPVSLYALMLLAFLLTGLILTGLARLAGLQSLVGLTTRLATSTA